MPLTDKEKYQNRIKSNKSYTAYIPNYIAIPFDEKLEKNNIKFTNWLKESMEKYLKKN